MRTKGLWQALLFCLVISYGCFAAEISEEGSSLDLPYGRPSWNVLQGLSLVDVFNFAKTQKTYWNNPEFWEDVAYVNRPYIRDGKAAAQIVQYMHTNLPEMLESDGRVLIENDQFLAKLDEAYIPKFREGIVGFLMLMVGDFNGGMTLLTLPGAAVTEGMQTALVNDATYHQTILFVGQTGQDRQTYLQGIVNKGGLGANYAQIMLNDAAYHEDFLFSRQTEQDRQTYLQSIVDKGKFGAEDAQKCLNDAAYYGDLLFCEQSEQARQAYLQGIVNKGGLGAEHAQECLNDAACDDTLGFSEQSEKDRQAYLQGIINKGGLGAGHAQRCLNDAAYSGTLGFSEQSEKDRQAYLQGIVDKGGFGARHAQRCLNNAACDDTLGFSEQSEQDRQAYLQGIVDKGGFGAGHAQRCLNEEAYLTELGFIGNQGAATSGYDYLMARAIRGDKNAQNYIYSIYASLPDNRLVAGRVQAFFTMYNASVFLR